MVGKKRRETRSPIQWAPLADGESSFGIRVDRKHTLQWLFHQAKSHLSLRLKHYLYSETALVLRLFNGENLVSGNMVQHLMDPAGPTDFNLFDPLGTTQAKVHPIITRGRVTYRCRHFIPLLASI